MNENARLAALLDIVGPRRTIVDRVDHGVLSPGRVAGMLSSSSGFRQFSLEHIERAHRFLGAVLDAAKVQGHG